MNQKLTSVQSVIPESLHAMSGILLLNKPLDMSSAKAVFKSRALFSFPKAGHTGSLDPKATGMLPICFGQATKYANYLLNADKTYEVIATLGVKTTTGDSEGDILETKPVPTYTTAQLTQLCEQFTGEQLQTPSMFSALKYQGKPLYQLAREGKTVERKPREITVFSLQLRDYRNHQLHLTVHCSKGTYIRNLVEDMGDALGCGAHVSVLHRLSVGQYQANQMVTLADLSALSEAERKAYLQPISTALSHYPSIDLSAAESQQLCYGQRVICDRHYPLGYYRLIQDETHFIGLGEIQQAGELVAKRLLKTENKAKNDQK